MHSKLIGSFLQNLSKTAAEKLNLNLQNKTTAEMVFNTSQLSFDFCAGCATLSHYTSNAACPDKTLTFAQLDELLSGEA